MLTEGTHSSSWRMLMIQANASVVKIILTVSQIWGNQWIATTLSLGIFQVHHLHREFPKNGSQTSSIRLPWELFLGHTPSSLVQIRHPLRIFHSRDILSLGWGKTHLIKWLVGTDNHSGFIWSDPDEFWRLWHTRMLHSTGKEERRRKLLVMSIHKTTGELSQGEGLKS